MYVVCETLQIELQIENFLIPSVRSTPGHIHLSYSTPSSTKWRCVWMPEHLAMMHGLSEDHAHPMLR